MEEVTTSNPTLTHHPDITQNDVKCAAESFGERAIGLGASALMRDGNQLASREVQPNATSVTGGFVAKVALLCTGASVVDHRRSDFVPSCGVT